MPQGYYRFPTLQADTVVFVSEDDLWAAPTVGGIPRRLTSNLGEVSHPSFSPDGQWLAFVGRDEGQAEIYCMPALGGSARRLTYLGGSRCFTTGWTADGHILFASNAGHWEPRFTHLYRVSLDGGQPYQYPYGPVRSAAFGPGGEAVIERSHVEPAVWKRYRGGANGQLWITSDGGEEWRRLLPELSNLSAPLWLAASGEALRVYFISDHEEAGNLYSCLPTGADLRRHTHHTDFYARNPSTDGRRIVYHAGGDLYLFDPDVDETQLIEIDYHSPRVHRNRKFVGVNNYLEYLAVHPRGQALTLTARGKLFSFYNWEGAVLQHAEPPSPVAAIRDAVAGIDDPGGPAAEPPNTEDRPAAGIRYRLPAWLYDGRRLVAVTDSPGEETFVIFSTDPDGPPPEVLPRQEFGRALRIAAHPGADVIAFSNHRYELMVLDLKTGELRTVDRGLAAPIYGFCWSPDGEWLAYSVSISLEITVLKLWNAASGETTQITRPVLRDVGPAFDPLGRYLYFLSYRSFTPVYDALHFELSFPFGVRPYLITLASDLPSPFVRQPPVEGEPPPAAEETPPASERDAEPPAEPVRGDAAGDPKEAEPAVDGGESGTPPEAHDQPGPPKMRIDLDGIQDRVVAFPVSEGLYGRIRVAHDGRVLYSRYPFESAIERAGGDSDAYANGVVYTYNFEDGREEALISGVSSFFLSADGRTLVYRSGNRLRAIKAGEKAGNEGYNFTRRSGWIDLGRVKIEVIPGEEWRQMLREAWRLQRDQFWTEDMSRVDWLAVYERYLPLVERVGSRSEFSDLVLEMQGELGTSHTYEYGGDYRPAPRYSQGRLAADFEYDAGVQAWRITHIYRGDVWDEGQDSPLCRPGVQTEAGDYLLAVNGRPLSRAFSPGQALVNQAGEEVLLTLASPAAQAGDEAGGESRLAEPRTILARTLVDDAPVRYREWVDQNRLLVHKASAGRLGYVHIPDMGPGGYAEFHRGFLAEVDRDGLIVDVRFNRGGHVSSLILEKLARRRLAYITSRWRQAPQPYPFYAVAGPIVALTNEFAGSDGDIFSHAFKLMKIGPLVGTRTWGGVIGISPSGALVDGSVVTQPEFAPWFSDIGRGLENFGATPDIEVEIRPQDYARGGDPQLERAVAEALRLLAENPPVLPDFSRPPDEPTPKLPET
jgi:tricorn protease